MNPNPQLEQIQGEIRDHLRALSNGFQRLEKVTDSTRQSKQLDELTAKMRECKRLIKEFDREIKDEETRNPSDLTRQLNDDKQSMIKELNSYVALMMTTMKKKGEVGMGTKGGECGMCGREERWLLHNISYRSAYKRACTNCVLKNHPGSFCPICFHVYSHHTLNPNPNNNNHLLLVSCLKCASQAHSSCAPPSPSFLCPSCASPSPAPFFPPAPRSLDKLSSRALLAASSIAASSMSRAALAARAQADKSVREAVAAKKRARDALDKLAVLLATADSNTGASDN